MENEKQELIELENKIEQHYKMNVFYIASVLDCGDYYQVQNVLSNMMQDFINNEKYVKLNNIAYTLILKALEQNKIVRIIKDFDAEVLPKDLIVVDTDELKNYKLLYLQKARQMVNHQQAVVSGLQMYEFIVINNYLCDKGFFIHDDNREEKYLEILETGDELLIEKLELYLSAREVIERASILEQKYRKLYLDINNSDSNTKILQIFTKFMEAVIDGQK